jgi:2-amino-4-hydroxy-6-hydroxymethyldihydropteridine diphosphokinase
MDIKTATVYLSLGSNQGEKLENLQKATDYISQRMRIERKSPIYDAAPMENPNQARFLNMCLQVTTGIPSNMVLFLLKGIEAKLGRLPGPANGPRIIDIDILLYGDEIVNTPDLKIPHPKMTEREFVLTPLAEIASNIIHPVTKKTIKEMADALKGKQGVNLTNFKF